jgi:hypothetical protein
VLRARNESLHKSVKGVEISKWEKKRCTRQFALNVERNVKSPSNRTQADLFTAVSAGLRRELQEEDSKSPKRLIQETNSSFFLILVYTVSHTNHVFKNAEECMF